MTDPIICLNSKTYERTSILSLSNNICLMTRHEINKDLLIPNIALKQLIEEYKKTNKIRARYFLG